MNEVERFKSAMRREILRRVLEAKNEGGDVAEAEATANAWAAREHRAATRTALKNRNPIDVLSRSEALVKLTVKIIQDVLTDVYGVTAC